MKKKNWYSEIGWLVIGLVALAWELFGLWTEDATGVEPLTHIVRDRLFEGPLGWVFTVAFIAFWGWLAKHWLVDKPGEVKQELEQTQILLRETQIDNYNLRREIRKMSR